MKYASYILILLLFCGNFSFSQNPATLTEEKVLAEKREFGNFVGLSSLALNSEKPEVGNALPSGNQIFIEQIGSQNNVNARTSSQNSDLKLLQYGDGNYISFITDAQNLDGTIIQDGNNNKSFDFTVNPDQDVSANLLQQGDNLHFERYGANSISNNLKIIQTGETRSIIIRNFQ